MSILAWVAIIVGVLVLLFVAQLVHLSVALASHDQKTRGLGYFGLPPEERDRFRATLQRQARRLHPILSILGRISKPSMERASFRYRHISGPKGTCSEESFKAADDYEARPADVFVVTQMKCGTTWMQHVVYEVLKRGEGNLVDTGTALYAVSPWLEALKSVPVDAAPAIGTERPARVIKTHMPADICPYEPAARYIYVARHPVSCFASCADFIATNMGSFAPGLDAIETWYCSPEQMWWGTWPAHVQGWWQRSQASGNVLFVRFEDMKADLASVVRRIAAFLELQPLTDAELARIVHKCGFDYMQQNRGTFEMHPPHILAIDAELFVKGTSDRHRDVPEDARQRIMDWCRRAMDGGPVRLSALYPESDGTAGEPATPLLE